MSSLACALPRLLALRIGSALASALYFLYRITPYRDIICQHIQQTLPLSVRQARQLARESIRRLVLSIVDFLRFPLLKTGRLPDFDLTLNGFHHVLQAQRRGHGVILVSAHYGFWEMIPATLALYGLPIHVLVQKPSVKAFDRMFRDFRAGLGIQTHYNDSLQGLRPLLKALDRGEIVGLVVDQHGESNQVIGTFFGHTVSLPVGPVFFARHRGSPIVPVFSHRTTENRHLVTFYPPVYFLRSREKALLPETEDKQDQARTIMQGIYDQMEQVIRQHPEDWLWVYNRWDKYIPG